MPISSLSSEEQPSVPLNSEMYPSIEDQRISHANEILEQKEDANSMKPTMATSSETLLEEIEDECEEDLDLSSEKSFSDVDEILPETDLYLLSEPLKETHIGSTPYQNKPKKKGKTRKALRYQKQTRPDESSDQSKLTASQKKNHKGTQKREDSSQEARQLEELTPPELPIYLTERAALTFEKLSDTSYRQKVTVADYYDLLKCFIRFNLNGYLRKVVQKKNRNSASELEFNLGEGESLIFLTHDNKAGYLSFHLPHDRDGNNHRFVPKEYRKEYMRIFYQFGIKLDDITIVGR